MIGSPGLQEEHLTPTCVTFAGYPGGHRGEGGLREEFAARCHHWGAPQVSNLPPVLPPLALSFIKHLAPAVWWIPFLGARGTKVKKTLFISWGSFQFGKGKTVKKVSYNHHTRVL